MLRKLIPSLILSSSLCFCGELHDLIRSNASVNDAEDSTLDKINELDQHGLSPLFYAVLNQNTKLINILLEKGAQTEIEKQARSPLWAAVVHGDISLINQLMAKKADAKKISNKGYSPIGAAIMSGRVQILETLAPECDGAMLLEHFTAEMRTRTNDDPIPLRGEGMHVGGAVRDAVRAKHTQMALFLLGKGVPLAPGSVYPGGYAANTPFCLFEGLQTRTITPELAAALIKAGENPYARVTSQSNISRSPMMPTTAMEAALLVGKVELVKCLMENTEPGQGDYLGNLAIFANASGSYEMNELSNKHFAKLHEGNFTYPMPPQNYRMESGFIRSFASRLLPNAEAPAEKFDGRDDSYTISLYANRGAKKHLPTIKKQIEDKESWKQVVSEEIEQGLDHDYWDGNGLDAGELGKATDARVICVLEIIEDKEIGNLLICHLISSSSGICFASLSFPEARIDIYDIALEITNAWRNWKERCSLMDGKFHAVMISDDTEPEASKSITNAIAHIPQWILLTKTQFEKMKDSEFIRSCSVLDCQCIDSSADRKSLVLTLQESDGSTITTKQDLVGALNPFIVKSALAEMMFKSRILNDTSTEALSRHMQRMYASGNNESALFLTRMLQFEEPSSLRFHSYARQQLGNSLKNFINYSVAMAGIRNMYYPVLVNASLERIQVYQSLMMEYATMLNEELIIASKTGKMASNDIKPVSVGQIIRLLANYRFFLRPGIHPEFMDEMESAIARLIKTTEACYPSDAERLQLCIGIVGSELRCINRFDLHRCPSLRDFLVSELIKLSKSGLNKSGPNLNLGYFDHCALGECFQRVLESCCTPQARASWDNLVNDSFNELIDKSKPDTRILLEKKYYCADETLRSEIAKEICDMQCSAIKDEKIRFFTGVRLFDLARYVPINLASPRLHDPKLWQNEIIPAVLTADHCNGEMMWNARQYHAQAAITRKLSTVHPSSSSQMVNYMIESPKECYEFPANTREKIYLNPFITSCRMDEIIRQSKLLKEDSEAKFGEKQDIPDISNPASLLLDKKISLLDSGGKASALLAINSHFSAETDTVYFSCMKSRRNSTITIYDRKQQRLNAELISVNLKNGKIQRQTHPEFDAEGFFFSEERHGHIVGGKGKSMIWILGNSNAQVFDSSTLACKPTKLKVVQLHSAGRNHAFLDDTCFIQTQENESKDIREIQVRGKIIGVKPDGTFFSVVDSRRSPAINDLDHPGNYLEGVFAEGGKIHVFTNQAVTYHRVNPMLGVFAADGGLVSVENDANKVNERKTSFMNQCKIDNLKVPLVGENYVYARGLPGRILIKNDKGKEFAINIEFSGLSEEKTTINYPIFSANLMVERQDEMPLSDFVKTVFIRPQIVAVNQEHLYVCAAMWNGELLPYIWRIEKKSIMQKIGLSID